MADPTSAPVLADGYEEDVDRLKTVIKDSEALVLHAPIMLNMSTGKSEFADDADNLLPLGLAISPDDGNPDHLTGDSTYDYKVVTRSNIIVNKISVTGASAITDIGKLVYCTDGSTYTLTKPTTGLPVGFITNWRSSTYCDVYFFGFKDAVNWQIARGHREIMDFGTFPTNALQGTAAVTLFTAPAALKHYKFISLHAQPMAHDNAAVAGAQTVNLAIGGTNVTGGVLSLGYGDCDAAGDMGTEIDATAITAANEVHEGDVVTLLMAASGTGFTADAAAAFKIYAIIENMIGA